MRVRIVVSTVAVLGILAGCSSHLPGGGTGGAAARGGAAAGGGTPGTGGAAGGGGGTTGTGGGTGGTTVAYQGPCDLLASGCAEAYGLTRAMTSKYTGPLFQLGLAKDK